ncbi:MAG: DNA/RNA nuclease SfsA [Hyphomicrobiaceae bacterium]
MKFASPLVPGRLVKRYKRFLADVVLDTGETVTATCPNTGSMMGLVEPGLRVWLSESDSATRKYRHTWEIVETDLGHGPVLVGINTGHPNRLVTEAIGSRLVPELCDYPSLRREVRYGLNSRIDLLLESPSRGLAYVEVKNVHMMRTSGLAEFPDSVTERGVKHLGELMGMVWEGHRAVMVFLIQRADAERLSLARDVDAGYGTAFDAAIAAGVEAVALRCTVTPDGIDVTTAIPIVA